MKRVKKDFHVVSDDMFEGYVCLLLLVSFTAFLLGGVLDHLVFVR